MSEKTGSVWGNDMKENEVLLSICISTYEKGTKCRKLVDSILELNDDRYDVIVCDDNSSKECISILNQIHSKKIKIKTNEINAGACKNWYKTIAACDGKYALHVLDRDTINIEALKLLLDFLEEEKVECGHCGFAADFKAGNTSYLKDKDMFIYQSGLDALSAMGGIPVHPTGFVIKKSVWEKYDFKKYFYEEDKYGIYPHAYVLGIMACKSNLFWFAVDFYSYQYTGDSRISRFYSKSDRNYYWLPSECISTQMSLINELTAFINQGLIKIFEKNRIVDCYKRATIGYKESLSNYFEMSHYGLKTKYISNAKLVLLSFYVLASFMVAKENKYSWKFIANGFIENVKLIKANYTHHKTELDLELTNTNKFKALFELLLSWMCVENGGKRLPFYLAEQGYKKVAIYGMGKVGQALADELQQNGIDVAYGIDRKSRSIVCSFPVVSPVDTLELVDLIIITPISPTGEIENMLKEKTNIPVLSLEEIVGSIE